MALAGSAGIRQLRFSLGHRDYPKASVDAAVLPTQAVESPEFPEHEPWPLGEILFTLGDWDQEQDNSQNQEHEPHERWGLRERLRGRGPHSGQSGLVFIAPTSIADP